MAIGTEKKTGNVRKPSQVKTDKLNKAPEQPVSSMEAQEHSGSRASFPDTPNASPSPTSGDAVQDASRLGGQTVKDLREG